MNNAILKASELVPPSKRREFLNIISKADKLTQDQKEIIEQDANRVIDIAAWACGVSSTEALSRSRKEERVSARSLVSWYLLRKKGWSLTAIGRRLNCHHATIINLVNRCENLNMVDKRFKLIFENFLKQIENETTEEPTLDVPARTVDSISATLDVLRHRAANS